MAVEVAAGMVAEADISVGVAAAIGAAAHTLATFMAGMGGLGFPFRTFTVRTSISGRNFLVPIMDRSACEYASMCTRRMGGDGGSSPCVTDCFPALPPRAR